MGTAAASAVAVLRGARILRVHDVDPMRELVRVLDAIMKHQNVATGTEQEE